jgi:hypothetical protein
MYDATCSGSVAAARALRENTMAEVIRTRRRIDSGRGFPEPSQAAFSGPLYYSGSKTDRDG